MITVHKNKSLFILLAFFIAAGVSCKSKIPENPSKETSFHPKKNVDLSLFFKAEEQFQKGKFNQSRAYFRQLSHQFPDSSGIWARIATCYAKQQNFSPALLALDTAINLEPNNYHYMGMRANWLAKNNQYSEAANAFLALSSKNHRSWTLIEEAAVNSYRTRNYEKLLEICDTWSTRFGLNDRVAYYYLYAYDRQNDSGQVLTMLNRLEKKYPYRVRYGKKRLEYLTRKGYFSQAYFKGEEVYKMLPNDDKVVYSYLQSCFHQKDWTKVTHIVSNISQNPNLKARTARNSFKLIEKKKQHIPHFDSMLNKANTNYSGQSVWDLYYSGLQSVSGDFSSRIKVLKKSVEEHPSNIGQWEDLLQLLYFTKDKEQKAFTQKFIDMYPFINVGKLYAKAAGVETPFGGSSVKGEYLHAIEAYDLWKKEAKKAEALSLFKKECSNTNNPIILFWMYEIAKDLKKTVDADKYLEKAKKNGAIIE